MTTDQERSLRKIRRAVGIAKDNGDIVLMVPVEDLDDLLTLIKTQEKK